MCAMVKPGGNGGSALAVDAGDWYGSSAVGVAEGFGVCVR